MHVAPAAYLCLADAIFFERWSATASAFDLLDLVTWHVILLPRATMSAM